MKLAEAKVGRTPAYFNAMMYSARPVGRRGGEVVDGQVEDRDRFLAAIRKASETIEDPRGPIKLDESGNPTENVYILKVERVDGKLTEHRPAHVPDGLAVLDLQARRVLEDAGVRARLSAGQAVKTGLPRHPWRPEVMARHRTAPPGRSRR